MKKQHKGLRRAAALLSSIMLLVVVLLPCFVQPAAAYDAQGETTWFITDRVEKYGIEYYEISPWSNGELYYAYITAYCRDQTMTNISVNVPGYGESYFGRMLIYMESTLRFPRTGFYVDEDWFVSFDFGESTVEGMRVALIDSAAWPMCYYSGLVSSSEAQRVYSLYCRHFDYDTYDSLGIGVDDYTDGEWIGFSHYGAYGLYVPTAVIADSSADIRTENILVKRSAAGGYSANIVPLIWFPCSADEWEEGDLEIAYRYYCPVSKLGDYEIGDAFPRSEELDIDAILDALDTLQVQYADTMQYVGHISPSDLIGFNSMLDSTNSAADNYFGQTVGAVDSETISPWFTDNPFMAVIGMIVCIGFVGMVLKKAVT